MLLVYILFCPRKVGHDTQVSQLSHSILPCGALYKLDPLETKGLHLDRFWEGMHSQTLFSRRSRMIIRNYMIPPKKYSQWCKLLKTVAAYNMKCKEYINTQ